MSRHLIRNRSNADTGTSDHIDIINPRNVLPKYYIFILNTLGIYVTHFNVDRIRNLPMECIYGFSTTLKLTNKINGCNVFSVRYRLYILTTLSVLQASELWRLSGVKGKK